MHSTDSWHKRRMEKNGFRRRRAGAWKAKEGQGSGDGCSTAGPMQKISTCVVRCMPLHASAGEAGGGGRDERKL